LYKLLLRFSFIIIPGSRVCVKAEVFVFLEGNPYWYFFLIVFIWSLSYFASVEVHCYQEKKNPDYKLSTYYKIKKVYQEIKHLFLKNKTNFLLLCPFSRLSSLDRLRSPSRCLSSFFDGLLLKFGEKIIISTILDMIQWLGMGWMNKKKVRE
jgi:hypothetical protein